MYFEDFFNVSKLKFIKNMIIKIYYANWTLRSKTFKLSATILCVLKQLAKNLILSLDFDFVPSAGALAEVSLGS